MKWIIFILLAIILCMGFIEAPPPVKSPEEYQWAEKVRLNLNAIQIPFSNTNPNGTKRGEQGQLMLYATTNTAIGAYLMVNASGDTVWYGILLEKVIFK